MKLIILGSSSAGNCYLLDNGKEALMIECGVPFRDVKKAMDFDITRISACIVSHEHGDHARYVKDVMKSRIPLVMSEGTADALGLPSNTMVIRSEACKLKRFGGFKVKPFKVMHDCAEPFGYLISHPETGTILFATDTCYLEQKFRGLNNILLECNYDTKILEENVEKGKLPDFLANRTVKSHMSLETCIRTLQANNLSEVNNIVLIHLSPGNSNAVVFKAQVEVATGKNVIIAQKGLSIEFNKEPF